jgi:hypothetical protein
MSRTMLKFAAPLVFADLRIEIDLRHPLALSDWRGVQHKKLWRSSESLTLEL